MNEKQNGEASLRKRAEREADEKKFTQPDALTPKEIRIALHELQVHQIELELQNEELRYAQAEIEKARARYFDLYEMAPIGYCTLSEKGIIQEANLTAAGLLGAPRCELIGKPFSKFVYKEDQDLYYLHKLKLFDERVPMLFEIRLKSNNGAYIWADINASILPETDERQPYRITISDITERKMAEDALHKNQLQLQAVLKSMTEGVIISDPYGNIISFNDVALAIHQYKDELQCHKNLKDYSVTFELSTIDGNPLPLEEWPLSRALRGETFTNMDVIVKRKDIDYIGIWRYGGTSVRDANNEVRLAVLTIKDITESKKTEEKVLSLVKKLEEVDRNKNYFISVLSHELRNPLAALSAGVQLLELTQDKNQADKAKEIMKRQIDQLCNLVDDLLDLTRINQNKIKLKKENINLNKIVKNAIDDYRPKYEKNGKKLGARIQIEPIFLNADPVRIHQIIVNLLHNAHKFTQANGVVWLTLKTERNHAVISVKDNGKGIRPELLPKVFEPFMQEDISLARKNSGLGLGLSIVKSIVELHEGSVSAHSDGLGKGSTFTIRLPISTENNKKIDEPIADNNEKKNLELLIIEDNSDYADLLNTMLSTLGYSVATAYDGTEGIKLAKQIKPDVIFCDIGLPGMNGYEVAGYIRKDNELKDTKLIALTGYADSSDVERAIKAGFNTHLAKPIDFKTLQNVFEEYCF